jgi:putative NADPH-quinone reductase
MRILSLIAHPRESSFCHAISERVRFALSDAGHDVVHHDLYAEGFDPCLKADEAYTVGDTVEATLSRAEDPTVRQHRSDIAGADGLFVVHPNWWGKPPAILSGWMDRVLVPGVAYRLRTAEGLPEGLLAVRTSLVLNTSDTPAQREEAELGDPLEAIWGRCVLPYCGVKTYRRHVFRPVVGSTDEKRAGWLDEAEAIGRTVFALDR